LFRGQELRVSRARLGPEGYPTKQLDSNEHELGLPIRGLLDTTVVGSVRRFCRTFLAVKRLANQTILFHCAMKRVPSHEWGRLANQSHTVPD
jgi:hypothetical protein